MQPYTIYLFLENCSTCFGWYLHPSSGAHKIVFTVSGTCQNRYCYLPLLWKSWNWFECGVGIVLICFVQIWTGWIAVQTCLPDGHHTNWHISDIVLIQLTFLIMKT